MVYRRQCQLDERVSGLISSDDTHELTLPLQRRKILRTYHITKSSREVLERSGGTIVARIESAMIRAHSKIALAECVHACKLCVSQAISVVMTSCRYEKRVLAVRNSGKPARGPLDGQLVLEAYIVSDLLCLCILRSRIVIYFERKGTREVLLRYFDASFL